MRLEALAQLKPACERLSLPLPPDMPSAARSYVNTCGSKIHETTAGCVLLEHQSRPATHVGTIVIQAFVVPAVRQQSVLAGHSCYYDMAVCLASRNNVLAFVLSALNCCLAA